ncbi:MAG: Na+/H+ antiporter [Bradyrhizobium sp.]
MEVLTTILILLTAVVASSIIARAWPAAPPLPLIQIALGALIAQSLDLRISLEPDSFLLLFVAPLLFLDGWRIPREGLFRDKWTIIALAIGLVVVTVVGAGFFIHWLIPAMPLAVAFALAAVLSPTDAVALSAITARTPVPKRLMHILEGESLLNDASGLVCLQFAIAAAITGTFSVVDASTSFIWLATGGIGIGVVGTVLANAAKDGISKHFGEETGTQILISLLIPFGVYIAADHLKASGILAAVAAGMMMGYEERSGRAQAITRIRRAAVWDAIQFAGNGTIFVLLGQQLPGIVRGAEQAIVQSGREHELWLLAYIVAISCALATVRSLWVWATLDLFLFRRSRSKSDMQTPVRHLVAVASLAGVRGALTLSGVMTLPLILNDGSPFPTRDLAIILAAGTIIVSMITASVGLPRLMKGVRLPLDTAQHQEEEAARLASAHAAIRTLKQVIQDTENQSPDASHYIEAAAQIASHYRQRIKTREGLAQDLYLAQRIDAIELELRILALHAERNELYRLARSGQLVDEIAGPLIREIDLQESRFLARKLHHRLSLT